VAVLATHLEFGNGGILIEIAGVVNRTFTPHMAIHTRAKERAVKTEGVFPVTRRKPPAVRVGILAAGIIRERRLKKVISPSYAVSNTRHGQAQCKVNLFGLFREFRAIGATLELAHVESAVLSKNAETAGLFLLTNGDSSNRQISKFGTLPG
jgi:hypothetical protein